MVRRTSTVLHFVEKGAGVPVLALHGWTPDHRLMSGCLEPVFARRAGYRRLYPDLPGMGTSPAPTSMVGSDDVLAAVADFVDDVIGPEPYLLVGESYGGYLARALVAARPAQVLGLALICPIGVALAPADRTVPEQQTLRADPELLAGVDADLAEGFADVSVVQTPGTLHRYREEIAPGLAAADTTALERIGSNLALSVDPNDAPSFERPVLIITGRQDHWVGYVDQFALLPQYPRASYAVLDVAGHNLQIEQPDLFDALMLEWLTRVADET